MSEVAETTRTAGFVLVGGRSSRMGSDKALLVVEGGPLAQRLAERVRAAAGSAALVGSREKYGSLGWPVVEDIFPARGPLGGVHAALRQTPARWNLIVGCDLPFLTAEFMAFLLKAAEAHDVPVLAPVSARGEYEPLAAVYRRDCVDEVQLAIERQEHQMRRLLERLGCRAVTPADWRPFDPEGVLFQNVNTPEDYERARRKTRG